MDNIQTFDEFNEAQKWIQDVIKKPGALKKSLKKKSDEKISKTEINDEISKLKRKDKDKDKKGLQGLSKNDLLKYRRLNLAKTLKSLKENYSDYEDWYGNDDYDNYDGKNADATDDNNLDLSMELEYKLRTISDDSKLTIDDFLEECGV